MQLWDEQQGYAATDCRPSVFHGHNPYSQLARHNWPNSNFLTFFAQYGQYIQYIQYMDIGQDRYRRRTCTIDIILIILMHQMIKERCSRLAESQHKEVGGFGVL